MSSCGRLRQGTQLARAAVRSSVSGFRQFHASSRLRVVHDVKSKEEFAQALKQPAVMLDCFATWCGPCKAISPILARLSDDPANKSVHFIKIDVDQLPDVSRELGIRAMPTFMFFKDGEKVEELIGADPVTLTNIIAKHR